MGTTLHADGKQKNIRIKFAKYLFFLKKKYEQLYYDNRIIFILLTGHINLSLRDISIKKAVITQRAR